MKKTILATVHHKEDSRLSKLTRDTFNIPNGIRIAIAQYANYDVNVYYFAGWSLGKDNGILSHKLKSFLDGLVEREDSPHPEYLNVEADNNEVKTNEILLIPAGQILQPPGIISHKLIDNSNYVLFWKPGSIDIPLVIKCPSQRTLKNITRGMQISNGAIQNEMRIDIKRKQIALTPASWYPAKATKELSNIYTADDGFENLPGIFTDLQE
jgi:hypothetical protein